MSGNPSCSSANVVSRRAVLFAVAAASPLLASARSYDRIEVDPNSGAPLMGNADDPILPGSLVKPFTALAYARSNPRFPKVTCTGCWAGKVHGTLHLPQAIAVSCNRYFEALSLRVDPNDMRLVCAEYGLPEAPDIVEARLGLGRDWRIAPAALLRAYLRVVQHASIREGMRLCAKQGTAKAIGKGLAKTGTAPCEHAKRMPGDGLAVWLWPEDQPRRAVLVREHGVPGSIAARRVLA